MLAPAPLLALALAAAPATPDLRSTAERSGFTRTGRHEEAVALCRGLASAYPRRARCAVFGTTPEGRPMVALAASADGALDPGTSRARGREVVLVQGGIHAGEIEGKDAGFLVLRDLLASADGGPLRRVTVLFVPILNVDGHERFGPNQRPNQRGPEEAGWRVTARNLNLNRDYLKADAPETRALLGLLEAWDPVAYADLHTTDGAQFQPDVAVLVEPRHGYAPALHDTARAISAALVDRLRAGGHEPLDFYPSFVVDGDPASGFARGVAPPRLQDGYWPLRNRLAILLETHSWRTYPERVRTTADFVRAFLDLAAEEAPRWRDAAARADRESAALAGTRLELAWTAANPGKPGARSTTLRFPGYAYTRDGSPVTGAPIVRYDEATPQAWEIPLQEGVTPTASVVLPRGGWLVPAAWAGVVEPLLTRHGVRFERLASAPAGAEVEVFRATEAKPAAEPTEGRHRLVLAGGWATARRDLAQGALWVPVDQPRAPVAAHLLEPDAPDALVTWGFFDAVFEQKEYLEDYVLEPFAREVLARDPAVRAAFERRLAEDPTFAADPKARLGFFYPLHPSADPALRVYPVLRAAARP
jgi:hypothetical protein